MISRERWNWAMSDNEKTMIERTDKKDAGTDLHKKQIQDIIAARYSDYKKVLDVGCGDGLLSQELAKYGFDVRAISLNRKEVDICQSKSILCNQMDMHDLKFVDGCFDMIYCCHSLEHSPAPFFALCEFNRVLKMGGILITITPFPDTAWQYFPTHYLCPTVPQLDSIAEKSGFNMAELFAFNSTNIDDDISKEYLMIFKKTKNFMDVDRVYRGGEWVCKQFYKKN